MTKRKYEAPVYPEAPLKIARERFCELLNEQIEKGNELLGIEVPKKTHYTTNYGGFDSMSRNANHVDYEEATPAMIKAARNDDYTNDIVEGMHKKLIYNTFLSTCLQKCRNFRDFIVDYVRAWNWGRRDFGNLVRLVYASCA